MFNRSRTGYASTQVGDELAEVARTIESQVLQAERRVVGQDLRPTGTVRVTTLDSLLFGLLSPIFTEFRKLHPDISVEISISNQLSNLSKREADIAIRPTASASMALIGRKVATLKYAVYGPKEWKNEDGRTQDLRDFDWVGPDDAMIYPQMVTWMNEQCVSSRCSYRVDSLLGMYAAVRDGQGLAVLPYYLGDSDARLARFSATVPEIETELWVLTHPDLKKTARIRALMDFLPVAIERQHCRLLGTI